MWLLAEIYVKNIIDFEKKIMLTSQQRKKLQDALIGAFPERSLLEQLLDYELDKKLNLITQDSNLQTVVYQLIQRAQSEGWLIDLVRAARQKNPGNSQLRAIAQELFSLPNIPRRHHISNYDSLSNANFDGGCTDIEGIQSSSEHKYPRLVFVKIRLLNLNFQKEVQQFNLILDISFGEEEEKFQYKEQLGFVEREGYIRFGIKFGELCFQLTNGCMPTDLRKFPKIEQVFGLLSPTGTEEYPIWQFKVDDKKSSTLFGCLTNQELGIISLQNIPCVVEATFQINVNSNNLGVTAQEGVWNAKTSKKVKETKLRAFFKKVVEPKLKDYVSKVVLEYDSTSNS
ncbi:hypothetical protein WA1_10485 [Scytonema hofmannii PCC 7110]|uniref:Effector-associated domain-containing protein n=1 Tax=Scytonema hofmannii PCC 7110 TaxID=128403 RepID=A0A139XFK9_9CYAN|nr:effector-associated domain EAD1-containing protein [Scytonema hofmannii]KYC43484.1 hypothetical protein WA1_10485 [Scytonema hofmannii PCC 7110]